MVLDIILAVVPIVKKYTVVPIKRNIGYAFCYRRNIDNLKKEVEKLTNAKERVQHSVDDAKRNVKEIETDVEKWLIKVSENSDEARKIIEDEDQAKKRCFIRLCPNFKTRYQLGRNADKAAIVLSELREEGRFDTIFYHTAPLGVGATDIKGYEAFESRISVFGKIMDVLTASDIDMIGMYGYGGVGKTTMAKMIAQKATEEKLFDVVVMVIVTETPSHKKIQDEIADILGLKFDEKSERGRASRLREGLKKEKKILVILDDLWKGLDLEAVGISFKDEHKGCKIMLASRKLDVLLKMDCQNNFSINVLHEEDAWNLFKRTCNNLENSHLESIAFEVAKKCEGLPVAIVTVARALKNKSLELWENALDELERPSKRNSKGMESIKYSPIELSYDRLETEELKSIFLLCSLLGNNSSIQDLLKYVIGLSSFGSCIQLEKARNKAYSIVHDLKGSCLLLDGDTVEQFGMHDIVRDVGLLINSTDHCIFTWRDEDKLDEWPDNSCKGIWLHCNVTKLPNKLSYPGIEFFHMHGKDPNLTLPDNIFSGIHEVKVLFLINFSFSSLPSSLTLLENLRTLCLDESILGDIAIIGKLRKLEILSFAKCDISQLPGEIGQLTNLKLLDLSDCSELEVIQPNVISSLSLLEELYMGNSFDKWEIEASNNQQQNNASLVELKSLCHLSNLEIHIRDAEVMPKDLFSHELRRYKIFVGHVGVWDGVCESKKTLKLQLNRSIHSEDWVQALLKSTEDLYLNELKGVKNVLYELDGGGFPQLKHLHLTNSPEIQYVINSRKPVHFKPFPILESLFLCELVSLEKICDGKIREQPFGNLRIIKVKNCEILKNLFPFSMAHGLSQLQKIKVTNCQHMEEIVVEESEAHANRNEAMDTIQFTQLRFLSLEELPKLRRFFSKVKTRHLLRRRSKLLKTNLGSEEIITEDEPETPMPLFTEKIVFPKLEVLKLKSINTERLWHGQLPVIALSVQSLTRLVVDGCRNLKYLFSFSMIKSLVQLKYLKVSNCVEMYEIIVTEGLEDEQERISKMLFPKLDFLRLSYLPELLHFCTGCQIECPQLKRLSLLGCQRMKTFISNYTDASMIVSREDKDMISEKNLHSDRQPFFDNKVTFPRLIEMELNSMDNLETIWHNQLSACSFRALRTMKISFCSKLLNIFPSYMLERVQRLEKLSIESCYSLEKIFELQGLNGEEAQAVGNFHLRDIYLYMLPKLKHIWDTDPPRVLTFGNLHSLYVFGCEVLKNLFPFSIARDLLQLEKLDIYRCGLEEIVAKQENGDTVAPCFMFPKLISLQLSILSKFRSFYPGSHTLEWPMLKKLGASNCENVKLFASKFQEIHGEAQQPLFLVEEVIPNLEELSLNGQDTITTPIIWRFQFPTDFHSKLNILRLQCFWDESHVSLFGFMLRFLNLETLILHRCSFQVIFSYEGLVNEEVHDNTLERLRNLDIYSLPHLRHIWDQDNRLVPLLRNLQALTVSSCPCLVNLAPSSASFQNLTNLNVSDCNGLLNLIAASTAKSLAQLIELRVSHCAGLTEIVAKEEDETKDENEIIFSKLEVLELVELRDLTSFSSKNYTFKFPSLEKVIVSGCPKMKIFSRGISSAPKLRKVLLREYSDAEVHWVGNLNKTIQHMYTKMVGFDGKNNLKLSEFPHLKEVWHGPLPVKVFSNLRSLEVDDCEFFSTAIPSNLLPFLKHLSDLKIRNCNSLEGIFDLEKPNADEGRVIQLLPELRELCLIDLPNLSNIYLGSRVLEFPSLKEITVDNCPKMKRFIVSLFLREQEPGCQHSPIVPLEATFPNLEELRVDWNDVMEEIQHGQLRVEFCCKLKALGLVRFPNHKVDFPTHFLQRFPNLEKLLVSDANFEEVVLHEEKNDEGKHTKLRALEISKLPKLVHLSKEDSQPSSVFQILETLEVLECGGLKSLVPSSVSFQCLLTLEVSKCHGIINLMTSTTAKSLVQLESMRITECQMTEEIVARVDNEVENEITFTKLQFLELRCLPSLTSFYSGKHALLFPSLETVYMGECPKMKIFSQEGVNTTKLKSLETDNEEYWKGNLNATVQHLFIEMNKEAAESELPSSSKQSTFNIETTQAEKNTKFAITEGLDISPEFKTSADPMFEENPIKSTLMEPESPQATLALEDSHEISNDKEAATQGKHFPATMGIDTRTFLQVNKYCQASDEDEDILASTIQQSGIASIFSATTVEQAPASPIKMQVQKYPLTIDEDQVITVPTIQQSSIISPGTTVEQVCAPRIRTQVHRDPQATDGQVILAPTIQQSGITPISPASLVEQASASTFVSLNRTPVRQDPKAANEDQVVLDSTIQQSDVGRISPAAIVEQASASPFQTSSFKMPICVPSFTSTPEISFVPITERSSHSPANFDSLFTGLEPLLRSSQASSSKPASWSNAASHQSSGLSFDTYGYSMTLIKEILMKPVIEVARSADGPLLLSVLNNLKNSPLLSSQQSDIIQVYIENFDSLVTYHPFQEQQIDRVGSLNVSISEEKKRIVDLETLYDDLASKFTNLSANKEALQKILHAMEQEENHIRANKEDLCTKLATRKEKLVTYMNALPEAMKQQRTAEERSRHVDDYWAKLQNLFA